ncbi:MAG: TetR/AcrR family transcriptional regulator [Bacteroidota bacterium]|nr:TetR/AcrR family transcriptional regulator [Bacteroidota bacterium]MDX5427204.1 TetR/AcrR family transcriptional regulator [Bacteroidota bacterium]MDX5446906.1 TetR/AcrR family transcriptional regulator [Bacteroidota bacterium]MDX5505166.1 TetR/AcrR family transcriptional regulator [Bacteroidota bacterium]
MCPRTPEQFEEIRERTRKGILGAALEEFSRSGYHAASMAMIAKRAGTSKGSIYSYFESKEELLQAVFNDLIELGDEIIPDMPEMDPKDFLRMMILGAVDFLIRKPELAKMLAQLSLQKDVILALENKIDKVVEEKINYMIPVLERLGYEDPKAEAWWIGAILDGMTFGYLTRGERYPMESMKQKLLKTYNL